MPPRLEILRASSPGQQRVLTAPRGTRLEVSARLSSQKPPRPMTCELWAESQEGWRQGWAEVRGWLGVRPHHCPWGDRPVGKVIPAQHETGEVRSQGTLKADGTRAHLDLGREEIRRHTKCSRTQRLSPAPAGLPPPRGSTS